MQKADPVASQMKKWRSLNCYNTGPLKHRILQVCHVMSWLVQASSLYCLNQHLDRMRIFFFLFAVSVIKLTRQLRTTPDRFLLFYTGYFFEEFPKGFWPKEEKQKRTVNNLTRDAGKTKQNSENSVQQILPSYEDYSSISGVRSGSSGLFGSKTKDTSVFITRENHLALKK